MISRAIRMRVGLVLVGLLLALGIAEGALRLFAPHVGYFAQPDETIGYSFVPGSRYAIVPPENCPGWGASGHINSHGLRDRETKYAKEPGVFRILALGDSYTEGFQFDLDRTWTKILESRLNRDHGSSRLRFEVINAGRSGMGTATEYLYYTHEGHKYDADLVLLLFIPNDYTDNSSEIRPILQPYFLLEGDDLVLDDGFKERPEFAAKNRIQWFRRHSYLLGLATKLRTLRSGGGIPHSPFFYGTTSSSLSPAESDAVEVTRRLILRLQQAVTERNRRFVLVNGSSDRQVNWTVQAIGPEPEFNSGTFLAEVAHSASIPYLDLVPLLGETSRNEQILIHGCADNGGRGHWAQIGHELAAEAMAEYLVSSGELD